MAVEEPLPARFAEGDAAPETVAPPPVCVGEGVENALPEAQPLGVPLALGAALPLPPPVVAVGDAVAQPLGAAEAVAPPPPLIEGDTEAVLEGVAPPPEGVGAAEAEPTAALALAVAPRAREGVAPPEAVPPPSPPGELVGDVEREGLAVGGWEAEAAVVAEEESAMEAVGSAAAEAEGVAVEFTVGVTAAREGDGEGDSDWVALMEGVTLTLGEPLRESLAVAQSEADTEPVGEAPARDALGLPVCEGEASPVADSGEGEGVAEGVSEGSEVPLMGAVGVGVEEAEGRGLLEGLRLGGAMPEAEAVAQLVGDSVGEAVPPPPPPPPPRWQRRRRWACRRPPRSPWRAAACRLRRAWRTARASRCWRATRAAKRSGSRCPKSRPSRCGRATSRASP